MIVDGAVLTPILTQEIKIKFKCTMLQRQCLAAEETMFLWAFKANLQPLMSPWNYWPLGPYQQK